MSRKTALGTRIIAGYLLLVAFVAITGGTGYWGIKTVASNLVTVGDVEAPIVDMAMEMEMSLLSAGDAMAEFKGATSVIANSDDSELPELRKVYEESSAEFDIFSEAVLEGKTLDDGTVVIKAENEELVALVREAAELHDTEFSVACEDMMAACTKLVAQAAVRNEAMETVEEASGEIIALAESLEDSVKEEIARKRATQELDIEKSILDNEVMHVDMSMEVALTILEARTFMEECAQANDLETLSSVEEEFAARA